MLVEPYFAEGLPNFASPASAAVGAWRHSSHSFSMNEEGFSPQHQKRPRYKTDVDGERSAHLQSKKRRLLRDLITSRLSKPFAAPSTFINGRSGLRIPMRDHQRGLTQNVLRKLALLNWAQQRTTGKIVQDNMLRRNVRFRDQQRKSKTESGAVKKIRSDHSAAASLQPLGLSNYEALDQEGDPYAEDFVFEPEDQDLNSNFNQCMSPNLEMNDSDVFVSVQCDSEATPEHLLSPEELRLLVSEQENMKEISSAILAQDKNNISQSPLIMLRS